MHLLAHVLLLLLPLTPSSAQTQQPVVVEVRLEGELLFPKDQLLAVIQTRANRRLLGIPGITPWKWLYELGARGCCFSERISQALQHLGEPPSVLDRSVVEADAERLRLFYRQEGYRLARITYRIEPVEDSRTVRVIFTIQPGPPTFIRWVRYQGVEHLLPEHQRKLVEQSLLHKQRWNPDKYPLTFYNGKQRYSEYLLLEERTRLISFFQNIGYAAVSRDSIRALVYPARSDSFDITFAIRTGPRYRFGNIQFFIEGPEEAPPRNDTLLHRDGAVIAHIENEQRLKPSLLLRTLQFRPGQWYQWQAVLDTRRRLERTGIFTFSDFRPQWTNVDTLLGILRLPIQADLHTRPRHRLRLEGFLLQRQSIVGTGSEAQLGVGVGTAYTFFNVFGNGEILQWQAQGSIAGSGTLSELFTSSQFETELSLTYPYLTWPLTTWGSGRRFYATHSFFSLRMLTARREDLNLIIRGRLNALFRLELQHTRDWRSYFDLIDLYVSDPDTTIGFYARFLAPLSDPVERERILEDYSRPQINSAFRYTLSILKANPFTRDKGYIREVSAEVGGNLPYLLDRLAFSPGTTEGSLPGLPFFRKERNQLRYQRYFRVVLDFRQYQPLNRRSIVAGKFFLGWAQPIGTSRKIPFDRRFFAGGVNSVRGWRLRSLGPGSVRTAGLLALGGNIKLEGSLEFRYTFIPSFLGAQWIGAGFVDAGNIWFGNRNPGVPGEIYRQGRFSLRGFYRQIALGAGTGLRIAWEYLILRFDLGWKVYSPVPSEAWLPEGMNHPRLYFAIGHAF